MSEAETHEHDEDEAAEPVSPETVVDEDEQNAEAEDAEPEPEPEHEPEPTEARDDREIEKAYKALQKENTRHTDRLSVIMGEDAQGLEPCPLCSHFAHGFIFPVPPPDEVKTRTLAALGLGSLGELRQSPVTETCETCGGEGETLSGSKRPEQMKIPCESCNARGFVRKEGAPPAPAQFTVTQGAPSTFANGEATFTEHGIDDAEAKRRMAAAVAQAGGTLTHPDA